MNNLVTMMFTRAKDDGFKSIFTIQSAEPGKDLTHQKQQCQDISSNLPQVPGKGHISLSLMFKILSSDTKRKDKIPHE